MLSIDIFKLLALIDCQQTFLLSEFILFWLRLVLRAVWQYKRLPRALTWWIYILILLSTEIVEFIWCRPEYRVPLKPLPGCLVVLCVGGGGRGQCCNITLLHTYGSYVCFSVAFLVSKGSSS